MTSPAEMHLAHLHRLLPPRPGALAVDVGCGSGATTRALAAAGWRALGVEVDDERVELARESGGEARFALGRGEALPEEADGAAVLLYLFSFHHVPEPLRERAIEEARRRVATDGRLHVVDPLPEGSQTEVVIPIDDERATRRHAQALLDRLDGRGWRLLSRETYVLPRIVADFDELATHVTRVDPARRARLPEVRGEMERRFAALARPVPGGFRLEQPCVAYHFARA